MAHPAARSHLRTYIKSLDVRCAITTIVVASIQSGLATKALTVIVIRRQKIWQYNCTENIVTSQAVCGQTGRVLVKQVQRTDGKSRADLSGLTLADWTRDSSTEPFHAVPR